MTKSLQYPLELTWLGNEYWVNGFPIDKETSLAISYLMPTKQSHLDLDHWIKTGEMRFEHV